MTYLMTHSVGDAAIFTLGMGMAFAVALGSHRAGFLDSGGAAATFILGTIVFGVGRLTFTVPILTFFVLSSLLSAAGGRSKKQVASVAAKGGRRDVWQVLANGGIPGVMLLAWYFYDLDLFYLLFIGALAAVTADTWGTEIGMLSRPYPRSILTLRRVPAGTSGGVSALGLAGSALGAVVLVLVAAASRPAATFGMREFLIVALSGFAGALADSVFGAALQAQYRCPICDKMTEKKNHCRGERTQFVRGYRWIDNDVVNLLCALSGTAVTFLGLFLL
jgi:uncharacterized protein (TIGR00297 family)